MSREGSNTGAVENVKDADGPITGPSSHIVAIRMELDTLKIFN